MLMGTFRFGSENHEVVVRGTDLFFHKDGIMTSIEGLKLSQTGVIKEFPDLEGKDDWRKQAIERLKEHIKKMKTEEKRMEYVKEELKRQGYEPLFKQRAGFRPEKFK